MPVTRPREQKLVHQVRVLLIEDEQACADLIAASFARIDWAIACVDTASTLRQALARLTLEQFDLVIAELDLPDSSGLATLDAVARACARPIIILADSDDAGLRDRVIAHGGSGLLHRSKLDDTALEPLLRLAAAPGSSKGFELGGSGIAQIDLSGRFLRVNRKLCQMLGYAENELVGRSMQEVAHPDEAPARGDAMREQKRLLRKDGSQAWAEVTTAPVRAVAGAAQYAICVMEDITERKQAEARQAVHARCQEALAKFGRAALTLRDPAALVDEAVRMVTHAVPAREVSYIEAGDAPVASAGLVDVLQCGVHFVCGGTAIVPVRRDGEVRAALCAQGEQVGTETLPFLNTLASLLSTGLQRIDSENRLSFLAQFDPLTGLANRAVVTERLSQMIEQAKRQDRPLALLFIDLDDFKLVNDTLQHAGGDELLKETALRLQSVVRSGDMVARINGDEFAVLLPDLARAEDAAPVAQKVLNRLSQRFILRGEETFVSASVGIAAYPGDGDSAEALIGAAQAAMNRARQSGPNSYHFFTSEITQRSRARMQVAQELRRALERNEFGLVYQPKIDLASGRPCGAEALLRWHHPKRGVVSPAHFIPVLEDTGLILPVGEWVIRRACEDIKAWLAAGLKVLPVAVNLSARQFRQQHLDTRIRSLVEAAGVDPALIEIEITESQLMEDPDHAVRVMNALRESGIRAAIDDFGTGYSSLAYLTRLPLAALKIDRSFVADALNDPADAAIVRTIIEMAHTLEFTVVAEGVETDAQRAFLRRFGCEQGQGYLFARPMSAIDFTALI